MNREKAVFRWIRPFLSISSARIAIIRVTKVHKSVGGGRAYSPIAPSLLFFPYFSPFCISLIINGLQFYFTPLRW